MSAAAAWDAGLDELIGLALREDLGERGDATSLALVDEGARAQAVIRAREALVVAGTGAAERVFAAVDGRITVETAKRDGERAEAGDTVMRLEGPARGLLAGERTALNLLQRLCGIATATAAVAAELKPWGTQLLDTRKTLPGWRALEKHAVACGGGTNHRMGLYDAVLIKDNHLAFWRNRGKGTLADAVREARERWPGLKIEIEVDTLEQLRDALEGAPDWVLLDNMSPETVREAVAMCGGRCKTEASGGITAATAAAYAAAGATAISIGALTHSARAADLGMDFL